MALVSNELVTYDDNILQYRCHTPDLQTFYNECVRINIEEGRPFTHLDFSSRLTNNDFRQRVHKLREVIETGIRSSLAFYHVRGVSFSKRYRPVTFERIGVGINMISILCHLRHQPPAIHNVKVRTTSNNLHGILKLKRLPENPNNHGIIFPWEIPPFRTKLQAYPNGTVHVDIACTNKPIAYSIKGVLDFQFFLGRYYEALVFLTDNLVDLPYPSEWTVTQYHFGRDGSEEISSPEFERRLEDVTGGLVRFYSKRMPDGRLIPRIEVSESPLTRLNEELGRMIREEMQSEGVFD